MTRLGLLFLILQLELSEAYVNDSFWGDAVEHLPDGSFILVADIKKALDGSNFLYIPKEEIHQKEVAGIDRSEWSYYFDFFQKFQTFGLPHGNGWLHELPWVITFLSYMKSISYQVEVWRIKKPRKKN